MNSIQKYFSRIDSNGDGQIDRLEFRTLAQQLGLNRTEEIIEASFDAIDSDHDGQITLQEFQQWWARGEQSAKPAAT